MSIEHARSAIEQQWRVDYNEQRPHRSLGDITPSEFTKQEEERLSELTN